MKDQPAHSGPPSKSGRRPGAARMREEAPRMHACATAFEAERCNRRRNRAVALLWQGAAGTQRTGGRRGGAGGGGAGGEWGRSGKESISAPRWMTFVSFTRETPSRRRSCCCLVAHVGVGRGAGLGDDRENLLQHAGGSLLRHENLPLFSLDGITKKTKQMRSTRQGAYTNRELRV